MWRLLNTSGLRTMPKSKAKDQKPIYGRGTGVPHPIDVHVGKRVWMRRLFLGMTQQTLANALGLTFQQVQKYEAGANRVSASRLSAMADILGVPIAFFFGDLQFNDTCELPEKRERRERMERPETIDLIRLYYAIPDQRVQQQFLELVKAVGERKSRPEGPLLPAAPAPSRGRRPRR
jgi:transcriptional regulator with XRE-family HTH domain